MTTCSVIIPTYNRARYVLEAIDSVLAQNFAGVEIIVVDDGSDDGTGAVLESCPDCVHYFYQPNQGPSSARNLGIEKAAGEYLAFLDSDDLWLPGKIQHDLELFRRYPEADIVVVDADAWVEGQLRFASVFSARNISFECKQPRFFSWSVRNLVLGPLCATGSICMRRRALQKIGGSIFDPGLLFDEDWDLELRMFSRCQVLFSPEILTRVRAFDDGTRRYYSLPGSARPLEEQIRFWQTHLAIIDRYIGFIGWGSEAESWFRQQRDELISLLQKNVMMDAG
jgi:glycosyltransferase involved in cell wall biosynthesis